MRESGRVVAHVEAMALAGAFLVDGRPITAAAAAWFEPDGTAWALAPIPSLGPTP